MVERGVATPLLSFLGSIHINTCITVWVDRASCFEKFTKLKVCHLVLVGLIFSFTSLVIAVSKFRYRAGLKVYLRIVRSCYGADDP